MSVLRQGRILVYGQYAGLLQETDSGYLFQYDPDFLRSDSAHAVSLTLPLQSAAYQSQLPPDLKTALSDLMLHRAGRLEA